MLQGIVSPMNRSNTFGDCCSTFRSFSVFSSLSLFSVLSSVREKSMETCRLGIDGGLALHAVSLINNSTLGVFTSSVSESEEFSRANGSLMVSNSRLFNDKLGAPFKDLVEEATLPITLAILDEADDVAAPTA